jgi:hypothetical protein
VASSEAYPVGTRCGLAYGLPLLQLRLEVLAHEIHHDRDTPATLHFRHPWRTWRGVDVRYRLNGRLLTGSRGKTVWYVPLARADLARSMGLPKGSALKIVKAPVYSCIRSEVNRLRREAAIQEWLAQHGMAPRVAGVVAIENTTANTVRWFSRTLHFPAGAVHLATVVEHVEPCRMPQAVDCVPPEFNLTGAPVAAFVDRCLNLGVIPYDLCLGNVFFDGRGLIAVDLHKWRWAPGRAAVARTRKVSSPWSS